MLRERRVQYQHLEHKADTGYLVTAPSLERLYIDAALALTDHLVAQDLIETKDKQTVSVSADTRENLLVRWLNEVLFLFEKHRFLAKRIVFTKFDGKQITATLQGEKYESTRHGHVSEIKAVTFHQLQIGEQATPEPHFFARIFLDL